MFYTLITTAPTITCLIWACIFGNEYRHNTPERRIMFWFMFVATLLFFGHFCYFNRLTDILPITDTLYSFGNLSVYIIYMYYVRRVTTNQPIGWKWWLLLYPATLISLSNALAYSILNTQEVDSFIYNFLRHEPFTTEEAIQWLPINHTIAMVVFPLLVVFSIYQCLKSIWDFNHRLKHFYSNLEKRSLKPIIRLQLLMVATSLISLTLNTLGKSFFIDNALVLAIPSTLFSILLFAIGFDAYRRKFTAAIFVKENTQTEDYAPRQINFQHLAEQITQVLQDKELYLNPDLKINELAKLLFTNRNYIYQAITNELHTNFAELINSMRINKAKQLIQEHPELTNPEIASMSGYNSESSFYRNFKEITGITPSQWKARNK